MQGVKGFVVVVLVSLCLLKFTVTALLTLDCFSR